MFVYNYRIRDRYNVPVASLAILADDDAGWRPTEFREGRFGCAIGITFPIVKLLDFVACEAELEESANPFARFLLAHLKALETRRDPTSRHTWKLRLIRGLYERGVAANDVRELFRLIDWLMALPKPLEEMFCVDVAKIQEDKKMPFVTTPERVGHRRGLREGIRMGLSIRFGEAGVKRMPEVEEIYEEDKLRAVTSALENDVVLEEIRKIWSA